MKAHISAFVYNFAFSNCLQFINGLIMSDRVGLSNSMSIAVVWLVSITGNI